MSSYDCPATSLLSSVYSQCWPAPVTRKLFWNQSSSCKRISSAPPRQDGKYNASSNKQSSQFRYHQSSMYSHAFNARPGSNMKRTAPGNHHSSPGNIHADLGLDQGTLHWKSWSNFKQDLDNIKDDVALYKITQDTFRHLTQQVHDMKTDTGRRYSGSGFKSSQSGTWGHGSAPVIHTSQLAVSLPTSPPSIQDHKEWDGSKFEPAVSLQGTKMAKTERRRPKSHDVRSPRRRIMAPPRPHSSIPEGNKRSNFDHLSSKVMGQLAEDVNQKIVEQYPGPFEIVAQGLTKEPSESESESGADDAFEQNENGRDSSSDLEGRRWEKLRHQHEYLQRKVIGSKLLPEVLDPEQCSFDYRSSNLSSPEPDPFPEPLTEPFCFMDLFELSQEKDWRRAVRKVPDDEIVEVIMDRLIGLERIQLETCELEQRQNIPQKKPQSVLQERKGWNADAAKPTERAQSALGKRKESKNCCKECLQVMCAGDCVEKRRLPSNCCPHCRQSYCTGSCTEYQYHHFIRQPRNALASKQRPKSCKSCTRLGKKELNTINANNVILGRPRSAFATFSSAHLQSVNPLKMSYSNESEGDIVLKRMKEMRLSFPKKKDRKSSNTDEYRTKRTAHSQLTRYNSKKVKGRDSLQPGKSYQSQRRFSLTNEMISTSAAKCNSPTHRVCSAKYKRQKSATSRLGKKKK